MRTPSASKRGRTARPANDWNAVAAPLAKVLELTRSTAQALAEALDMDAYDALLDSHEAGLSRAFVTPLFGRLKEALPSVIDRAIGRQHTIAAPPGPFPIPCQETLARRLMERVGFDFERGRLDSTHHPFCGGDPDDARVTTRYNEDNFLDSMFAVLHETGHAMYEQGLPAAWRGQPVGRSGGMALHESQSLFMEQQVCRGAAFFEFAAPLIREAFGADAADARWSAANLHGAATRVERSRIRVEADETTYPLHVILRFELEQRLIDGTLEVADIPAAWNAATEALLGFDLGGEHRDGCMQDVHWFGGIFGYFPHLYPRRVGGRAVASRRGASAAGLAGRHPARRVRRPARVAAPRSAWRGGGSRTRKPSSRRPLAARWGWRRSWRISTSATAARPMLEATAWVAGSRTGLRRVLRRADGRRRRGR